VGLASPSLDSLIEQGQRALDLGQRQALYRKVHRLIADEAPVVFLYSAPELRAVGKRVVWSVPGVLREEVDPALKVNVVRLGPRGLLRRELYTQSSIPQAPRRGASRD
jgi:hypothetical protein